MSLLGIQHKLQVGMCLQQRFKSVCTSAQSDQSLSFLPEEKLPLDYPTNTTFMQSDLVLVFYLKKCWPVDGHTCQLVPFATARMSE